MLTPRLKTIAANVLEGKPLADIGTDHGYIPVELVKNGIIPRAIAADVNPGPLSKAEALIKRAQLEEQIETRLGSGITVLNPGEVDTIVIAGMGGYLIAELLDAALETARSAKRLVLQPMNNSAYLRHYLEDHGFMIIEEDLAQEDKRVYEIIVAQKGQMAIGCPVDYLIGYQAAKRKHPLLQALIERKIEMETQIVNHTEGQNTENAKAQCEKSRAVIALLKEVCDDGYSQ